MSEMEGPNLGKLEAVILLYNEEEVIDEFSDRLVKSLDSLGMNYEIIFVVEGTDTTLDKSRPSLKVTRGSE